MTIDETTRGNVVIVRPDGRLTVETEQQLKQAVARLLDTGNVRLVLNLADVPYIDSCGLGTMVHAYTSARRKGGDLKLLNVGSRIQHLLTVTRLDTVLETCASEAEAERRLTVSHEPQAWIPEVTKRITPAGLALAIAFMLAEAAPLHAQTPDAAGPAPPPFQGQLEASGSSAMGTSSQTVLGGRILSSYRKGRAITKEDISFTRGTTKKEGGSTTVANEVYDGLFQHSVRVASNTDVYATAVLYHNFSLGVGLMQAYGVGVSHVFERLGSFQVQADLREVRERFESPEETVDFVGVRVEESKTWPTPTQAVPKVSFTQSLEIIPAFGNADALQARGYGRIDVSVMPPVSIGVVAGDDYIRNVTGTHKHNYFKLTFNVTYRFSKA